MLSGVRTSTVTERTASWPAAVPIGASTVRRASTCTPVSAAPVRLPSASSRSYTPGGTSNEQTSPVASGAGKQPGGAGGNGSAEAVAVDGPMNADATSAATSAGLMAP